MKISELIELLEFASKEYGDLEIGIVQPNVEWGYPSENCIYFPLVEQHFTYSTLREDDEYVTGINLIPNTCRGSYDDLSVFDDQSNH